MEEKDLKHYLKAGKILKEIQETEKTAVKPGQKLLVIAERIEKAIGKKGGKPAFPVNLSVNNNAAHYTPSFDDETVVGKEDVLKVDIGVHVNGCIADSAFTLDFSGKHKEMVKASEKALENAVKAFKPGVTLREIGKTIEETIRSAGFNPIQNLSGHSMEKYLPHMQPSIPNIDTRDERKIAEDGVYAIEPFATDGMGFVKEAPQTEIFSFEEARPLRNPNARKLLERVVSEYKTLPFAERWIRKELSEFQFKVALRELLLKKALTQHPILREEKDAIVTQAETTLVISKGKVHRLL